MLAGIDGSISAKTTRAACRPINRAIDPAAILKLASAASGSIVSTVSAVITGSSGGIAKALAGTGLSVPGETDGATPSLLDLAACGSDMEPPSTLKRTFESRCEDVSFDDTRTTPFKKREMSSWSAPQDWTRSTTVVKLFVSGSRERAKDRYWAVVTVRSSESLEALNSP